MCRGWKITWKVVPLFQLMPHDLEICEHGLAKCRKATDWTHDWLRCIRGFNPDDKISNYCFKPSHLGILFLNILFYPKTYYWSWDTWVQTYNTGNTLDLHFETFHVNWVWCTTFTNYSYPTYMTSALVSLDYHNRISAVGGHKWQKLRSWDTRGWEVQD